jgi:23S rRNA (pseudouridine1915-N3)-methyltransferase
MEITIVAVGRLRPGPEGDLIDTYRRRISWPVKIIEVEERRPLKSPERMRAEAELILKALPSSALIIALDERGEMLDSLGFAEKLRQWQDNSQNKIVFIIGGADGLAPEIRERAELTLCFGRMTWPHMLVRALLAEQIYRATCILNHHPYHK